MTGLRMPRRAMAAGLAGLLLLVAVALAAAVLDRRRDATPPADLVAATGWLRRATAEVTAGSRRAAADGTTVHLPDATQSYDAVWTRDLALLAESGTDEVPVGDLERATEFVLARQREDGAVPDRVGLDGTPVYEALGPRPPTDNPQAIVALMAVHRDRTGGPALFARNAARVVRAMDSVPRNPANGLVHVSAEQPHSAYGFTDTVAKTGDELFSSLLFWQASERLAALFGALGDGAAAERWRSEANRIHGSLQGLTDPGTGMLLAASGDCRQIDVWGSAFAVAIGAVGDEQSERIGRWLRANYAGIVHRGQIRHLQAGETWGRMLKDTPAGTYQNGAHWAVATGWVALALAEVDRPLAQRLVVELVADLRRDGIWEAVSADGRYRGARGYVASVAVPLPAAERLLRLASRAS